MFNCNNCVALNGDIEKCLEEGKAIIIEGSHIDPNLIVDLLDQRSFIRGNTKERSSLPYREIRDDDVDDDEQNETKGPKKGLIMAFFLTIQKKEEHHLFFEQWLSSRGAVGSIQSLGKDFDERLETLSQNFVFIQEYLDQQQTGFATHVNVNLHRLEETLDFMHTTILTGIERAYQEHSF
jgi:hypothetical protein